MSFNFNQPAYLRLRTHHAERRRPIAFWVGAGLSQPASLPTWTKLRDELLASALEIAATLPEEEGRAKEAELERAGSTSNLWDAFQILQTEMGRAEFREEIREIFARARDASIPRAYQAIWELPGVRGMLTLNLDEFSNRSHKRTRLLEDAATFVGRDAPDYAHILGAGRPFIANLHGVMDAHTSWIFTRDEIHGLVNRPGYREFISLIFGQMTVVFCGISAEDGAAGGFLQQLTSSGMDLGPHFWITDRADAATHSWASNAGLAVIRYNPEKGSDGQSDHETPILDIFSDLKEYISKDTVASPLIPNVDTVTSLPSVQILRTHDDNELRAMLSGYAKELLEKESHGSADRYKAFLKEYAPCIHQAWYITNDEPYNLFYDYYIEEKISTSPFSTVWKIRGKDGLPLALKVLRIENLINGPEIESFRRGIQSLEYLTKAEIPGTATLVSAYEIPTSLIMEFVDGTNLQNLAKSKGFDPWSDGLPILINVCDHLHYGHNLDQGVLHRDVRPSNIMVPNFYEQIDLLIDDKQKFETKLLNYDMSWHAHAKGQTISGNLEESGYYAPEQLGLAAELTRSTLVDSYGIGMCIYFCFSGKTPPTAGSKSTDWQQLLEDGFRSNPRLEWRSAPARLRRLVERATSPNQADRPMIDQIVAELRLIQKVLNRRTIDLPADYWAEELMCRSEVVGYKLIPGKSEYVREPRPGRSISLEGDTKNSKILLKFKNQAIASTNRSGIDRIWSDKLQRAKEILFSSGWVIRDETRYGSMEILLFADVSVSKLQNQFESVLKGLERGLAQVRIE